MLCEQFEISTSLHNAFTLKMVTFRIYLSPQMQPSGDLHQHSVSLFDIIFYIFYICAYMCK